MKKILLPILLLAAGSIMYSCKKVNPESEKNQISGRQNSPAKVGDGKGENDFCEATVVTLVAGQHINAGNVSVINDADYIYVTYNAENGYKLTETHLFVGSRSQLPVNNAGNAVPGQFPYSGTHDYVSSYTYAVPVSALPLGTCGVIAAHAVVKKVDDNGNITDTQTAWGKGFRIKPGGGNWAMAFNYCPCTSF